ncbi:MAG: DUF6512 family protein [Dehalococcoidia bacterium]|nr:DUF6512 family protein [Dehalococcoidia bacterium]
MKRSILKWELVGIVVISILGSVLHFAFEWSGNREPVGVIAAVNESVWEHFKIAFWPALFYAIFEYQFFRRFTNNFMIAKVTGIYVMPIAIAILFYSYTAALGEEILVVDILIFVIAVALGQLTSYKMLTIRRLPQWSGKVGLVLVIVLAIAFGVFTFYPPHLPVFRDAATGAYGIVK